MNRKFWRGKRVFLTGHTGFKGAWLALWLQNLGAKVHGYALQPPTQPNFFTVARVGEEMSTSTIGDIRDTGALIHSMKAAKPEIVLHMAAQSLVRYSYENPVETYAVNVMGTINLLEAIRLSPGIRTVVNVTTDKCYENRECEGAYKENEPLGGYDPYSSSKACAEIVTASWRRSFLGHAGIALATARSGNVIGGGDWAIDRLLPDFFRALDSKVSLTIRSPQAVRPWQHVLEPLLGYLLLAERLYLEGDRYAEAWNFGADKSDNWTVQAIVEYLCDSLPGISWQCDPTPQPHEAKNLMLDSSKAKARLGWKPRWRLKSALDKSIEWHKSLKEGADMKAISFDQLRTYEALAESL